MTQLNWPVRDVRAASERIPALTIGASLVIVVVLSSFRAHVFTGALRKDEDCLAEVERPKSRGFVL